MRQSARSRPRRSIRSFRTSAFDPNAGVRESRQATSLKKLPIFSEPRIRPVAKAGLLVTTYRSALADGAAPAFGVVAQAEAPLQPVEHAGIRDAGHRREDVANRRTDQGAET